MNLNSEYIKVKSSGEIFSKKGSNGRTPYEHQKRAMENMDCINQSTLYRSYTAYFILQIQNSIGSVNSRQVN